ncbi:hypothetical protein LSUE1_G006653 [Lachnellula suecica]|uniref:Rhodopsin domain-containing protein n=1 Tax=Lachnellula suecica TaxID=602035 RepID=A0A8T9C2T6_9HELO|nr:hypothetical protein LSUE1_G006653 [Lachnellula suecica]
MPLAANNGLGKPVAEQLPEQKAPYGEGILLSTIAYAISAMFVKLSLLAFYLRLNPNKTFKYLT